MKKEKEKGKGKGKGERRKGKEKWKKERKRKGKNWKRKGKWKAKLIAKPFGGEVRDGKDAMGNHLILTMTQVDWEKFTTYIKKIVRI